MVDNKLYLKVDGTPLSNHEIETVNRLMSDLYSPTTIDRNSGMKTMEIMRIRGVVSPSLSGLRKITKTTSVVPKKNTFLSKIDYINKYNLNDDGIL